MIEILLQAERALAVGLVDQAERLYRQAAEADPRNSIAVVGLARVALERADEPEAWRQAQRALAIDPENVAAERLAGRLEEVWAYRGESLPDVAAAEMTEPTEVTAAAELSELTAAADAVVEDDPPDTSEAAEVTKPNEVPDLAGAPTSVDSVVPVGPPPRPTTPGPASRHEPSAIDRLLRRNRS